MQHLYECLRRDIDYNPNQIQQFTQIQEPELPEFLYHLDEEEDPIPSFAMTNPYEALIIHDPARQCVRVTLDMVHSLQAKPDNLTIDPSIDIIHPEGSGETHFNQMSLWSIMSDRPSYTVHPQSSGMTGSGCMDFNFDRMNHQAPSQEDDQSIDFNNLDQSDFLTHYPDIVAELNINRSYDDLLDVSTTYLGPDFVQSNHVFNPEPTFPIAHNCHMDGELLGGGKLDILLDTGASKSYMSKAFYLNNPHLHKFPKFQSAIRHLQVGNGALVPTLFVIPLVFKINGHNFKVYTLVSEIQDKMDLTLLIHLGAQCSQSVPI